MFPRVPVSGSRRPRGLLQYFILWRTHGVGFGVVEPKQLSPHFFPLTRERVWNWLCSQQPYNKAVFLKTTRYLYTKAVLRWRDGQMWAGEQVKSCGNGSGKLAFQL